ncbi:MAG: ABC transporter ATP-binding protein [Termitinemataceae bacterium]|nr:MAG: ABC transporter ATP-binding protein [Termitinemataceae bacterium]
MNNYISTKEARHIAKENRAAIAAIELQNKKQSSNVSNIPIAMKDSENVLEIEKLKTYFFTRTGTVRAVDGISFDVPRGKTVGIVGESGCGKSITSLSVMHLLQNGYIVDGAIRFNAATARASAASPLYSTAIDITKTPPALMRRIRGNNIAMIFQDPMTSLNPVLNVGSQIDEVVLHHFDDLCERGVICGGSKSAAHIDNKNMTATKIPPQSLAHGRSRAQRLLNPTARTSTKQKKEIAKERTLQMLAQVGISADVYKRYPHELSGGMVQRVMIAMALSCCPSLIIADEPTTALDVTIQAQILDLLCDIKNKINASIMLITHDLGVVAGMADYVVVMYAGRIVEKGSAHDIFKNPAHPYTKGLMKSRPVLNMRVDRLYSIPGRVPNPVQMPAYCYFRDRCEYAGAECKQDYPPQTALSQTHYVSCYKACAALD